MQIECVEHARFLHAILAGLLFMMGSLGGLGCATSPADRPPAAFAPADTVSASPAERDSALSVLTSMRRTAFDSAFAALDGYGFTRHVRTEQLAPSGTTTAVQSYKVSYQPNAERGTLQRHDSTGAFRDGGLLASLSSPRRRTERPANRAAEALPDQPAYLAPRTRDAFRYSIRPDSLRDGTPTYVVAAQARREEGVRYARLTLTRPSHTLIGLTVVRAERALLFREDSRLHIRLRRAPDTPSMSPTWDWVPHVTRFRAVVKVPFRAPRQFRTVSAYYNYTL